MLFLLRLLGFLFICYIIGIVFFKKNADPKLRFIKGLITALVLLIIGFTILFFVEKYNNKNEETEKQLAIQRALADISNLQCYSSAGDEITFYNQKNNEAEFDGTIHKTMDGESRAFRVKGRVRKNGQTLQVISGEYQGEFTLGEGNGSINGAFTNQSGTSLIINAYACRK